ncbi:MAG: right-handed parallel beta-helix repeat-containing protein [Lewinellaceae bacterium]|nr:right-handed parallel beta-helix repeat-containing protein [Lewinellaceae bacterium]
MALLSCGLLLLFNSEIKATTYYVDAQSGSDSYNGRSAAFQGGSIGPWATIAKVNSIFFAPGDSVLFKRGAVWTDGPLEPRIGGAPGGTITIQETILGQPVSFDLVDLNNNNCIYFGAYGSGSAKPMIDCQGGRGIALLHDYIIVDGFHLDNGGNNMFWFGKETGNYWNVVLNTDVTHCFGNAVSSDFGGGNLWISGLYVYDYAINGILMNGSLNNKLKGVLIEDCWVENPVVLDLEDGITCHRDALGNDLDGDVIIRNNTIINSGEDGIDITSGSNILLDGNDISHSLSAGIFVVKSWVSTVEIRGNFLYSNSIGQGVGDLTIKVPNVWAYNNVIAGTGHHCLQLANTDNTRIWHNVIAPGVRTGNLIWLQDSIGQLEFKNNIFDFSETDQDISGLIPPNIVFDYNCYFGTSTAAQIYGNYSFQEYRNANPLFEPNGFWADPQFVNPSKTAPDHFRLASSSPCLNSGAPVSAAIDFWGTPRPQGAGYDLGIHEQGTIDCNPDPNIISYPGSPCDDGDPTTANDVYDTNCMCAGTPTACFGIGDADGDGVCTDVDCDDNDPNIAYQPGDACDDGDPTTSGEVIQANCSCSGGTPGPAITCSRVNSSNDDAEEKYTGTVDLGSTDLELAYDPNRGRQVIGMRFNGLNIPQGATILSAHLQFTVDDIQNINPSRLRIFGENSIAPLPFTATDYNLSNRPRTANFVPWAPPEWPTVASFGPDQRTPDIYAIIQELVNRAGYDPANAIVIIIDGIGSRTAESYDGFPAQAPQLCVEYTLVPTVYDCPVLSANIGYPCDDGDPSTINDAIDANCNCIGTPTPCTGIGDADGDGICADVDCDDNDFFTAHAPGDTCDDGDPTTVNDLIDANCNCTGTPTACTGIGDNDGDGVCADMDCNDNDPNITTQPGQACNDGDNTTINDLLDTNCNCVGTPTACTGIGDADGDGVCADVDCDDNDPNITTQPGQACNDGDNTTINDLLDDNCNCVGTPTACTGIGDADGDGVCADVDCDDNDPNITTQPGQACDDGNPRTYWETIQLDCSCGGGILPTPTCSQVSTGNDDAEESSSGSVDLSSSDLELISDAGDQTVGMRFNALGIPQGAIITSATIQFTVDETRNLDPCNLVIRGQASDNALAFSSSSGDVSSRPVTSASIAWAPPAWTTIGAAGDAQRTPDISAIIQEIVNRNGYTSGSSIAIIINGTGRRIAESYNGSPGQAPQLCVEYLIPPAFDCPALSANTGDACNDGDPTTINDLIDANCNCAGTPTACTGIGDNDGDGVCADVDCNDNDPNITTQPGQACNDGDPTTINDLIDANCNCAGTPTACGGIGDNDDGDGICADVDCNDNDPNITTQPGQACNDGDPTTINDLIDANCNCTGTPTACGGIGDNDGDGVCADVDCNDNDPNITTQPGQVCNDGDPTTINDLIDADCNCTGTPTACTGFGDNDGDGVCANVDCNDNDPNITTQPGHTCNDGDPTTINDIIDADCNCTGTPTACTGFGDNDGDGVCANVDCNDNDPNITTQPGQVCNDGDPTTINDLIDTNCNCAGTPTACTGFGDNDGDGVCANVDCNDNDPNITTQPGQVLQRRRPHYHQ